MRAVSFFTARVPKPVEESNHFDSDTELEDEVEEVDEDKTESEEEEEEEPAVRNIARSSRTRGQYKVNVEENVRLSTKRK